MSYQAMNLVSQLKKCEIEEINNKKFTPGVKCLLFAMANYCDENFQFYPSRQTLANDVGCCVKAIDNYNNYLIEIGLIEKVHRKGKTGNNSNLYELKVGAFLTKHGYTITMNEKGFLTAAKQMHTSSPVKPRGEQNSLGGEMVTPYGEMVTPDPINDPINDPKNKNISSSADEQESTFDILFPQLWNAWPNKKNKKRSVSAFKGMIRNKSGKESLALLNKLIIDIQARLKANQLGFREMMLSTYLNGERWEDDITDHNNQSVSSMDEQRKAANDKARRELFGSKNT